MTDSKETLAQLASFTERLAVSVDSLLAVTTCCPKWDGQQGAWRHEQKEDDPFLFLLLKLAGSASAVNAMLAVASRGFWFEAAVLARTVYDANLSIAFMLPTPDMDAGSWPSEKQQKCLREFAAETWDDPERPFDESRKRQHVPAKNIEAALGKFQSKGDEMNPHDAGQVAFQMMRFLSDYTHMAYPRLMEFLKAGHGYCLRGSQAGSAFGLRGVASTIMYATQTADAVALLLSHQLRLCSERAKASAEEGISEKLSKKATTVSNIENDLSTLSSEIEAISVDRYVSSKDILKRFKGKWPEKGAVL